MFKGKSLTDYTNIFHKITLKGMTIWFWIILWAVHMYKMESYCLKCKKPTENINPQVSSTSNGKVMILSKCAICNMKNLNLLTNKKQKDD